MLSGVATGRNGTAGDRVEVVGFVCLVGLCVAAGLALALNAPMRPAQLSPLAVEDTINPNDASAASLARLPNVGPSRAKAVVSYRSLRSEQTGGQVVFQRAEDLEEVAGIGPATVEAIRPWLSFESPSSGPSDALNPRP